MGVIRKHFISMDPVPTWTDKYVLICSCGWVEYVNRFESLYFMVNLVQEHTNKSPYKCEEPTCDCNQQLTLGL